MLAESGAARQLHVFLGDGPAALMDLPGVSPA